MIILAMALIICLMLLVSLSLRSTDSFPSQLKLLKDLISIRANQDSASSITDSETNLFDPRYLNQMNLLFAQLGSLVMASRRAQQFLMEASRFGIPSGDNLRYFDNYIVSYNTQLKQPAWVLEHLLPWEIDASSAVRHGKHTFCVDKTIHEYFRSIDLDYKTSGYDRGHFSPALDNAYNQKYLNQSFYLSNVAPQVPNLNRAGCVWARLETYVRYVARRSKGAYVLTGSLYSPTAEDDRVVRYRVIGPNRVAVPTHFYKVLVSESRLGRMSMEAYLVPNSAQVPNSAKLERFQVDIDQGLPLLEESAGLVFFQDLDRNNLEKPFGLQYGFGKSS